MAEGPTTFNGPLHDDAVALDARRMKAFFATRQEADATRDALLAAGLDAARITVTNAEADTAALRPADNTIIGKIREAILPDDSQQADRAAIHDHLVTLTVIPHEDDADRIVDIIQAGKPRSFDADLERWRNSPPSA